MDRLQLRIHARTVNTYGYVRLGDRLIRPTLLVRVYYEELTEVFCQLLVLSKCRNGEEGHCVQPQST